MKNQKDEYITGDTNGEFKHRFNTEIFPEQGATYG